MVEVDDADPDELETEEVEVVLKPEFVVVDVKPLVVFEDGVKTPEK